MAHDIFDYDQWDKNLLDEDEVIDLDEELRKQTQELLAQQWRDGELFVTTDYVSVYENPSDPSPIVCEFEPDTVILLASLKESHNYGGFRDVLLPIRGWIWTSVDEYDRAFMDASKMFKNVQTRETSTSMMRFMGKQIRKLRPKHKGKSKRAQSSAKLYNSTRSSSNLDLAGAPNEFGGGSHHDNLFNQSRDYAFSDADIYNPHIANNRNLENPHLRTKTNHLYVNDKQRQIKMSINMNQNGANDPVLPQPETPVVLNTSLQIIQSSHPLDDHPSEEFDKQSSDPPQSTPEPRSRNQYLGQQQYGYQSSREISFDSAMGSREFSSKFRKMSHQVSYIPAAINKIEKPIPLTDLDKYDDNLHITTDSHGHIKNMSDNLSDYGHNISSDDIKKDNDVVSTDIDNKDTDITTTEPPQESLGSKIVNSKIVRKTIHWIRSHPAVLTFIYILFTGFVEGIIFFDIITDVLVAGGLGDAGLQGAFAFSAALIITPYFIAWSSVWGLIEKKREQINKPGNKHIIWGNARRYRIFVTLFSFAPFGVILLMLFDCWIVFEFIIIRPIYFLFRFKLFRTDTFEELGYRKLRRVSEVCSETLFQAIVQLWILLAIKNAQNLGTDFGGQGGITVFEVVLSLIASFFVIILWFGIILRIESSSNGISLIEYLPIVLQGSFKFVPFLPAIEKGTKNGKRVNWCLFKFDLNALSALGKALGSPNCNLETIKVSSKTLKKLPRIGCKFFGRLMTTALETPIDVVISRLDRDLEDLFDLFDPEETKYFNFTNFCRATLALRAQDNETLKYREISKIFYELAAKKNQYIEEEEEVKDTKDVKAAKKKNEQKVWLLDLMLKLRTSKEYISVLDVEVPEDYCVKKNDLNLLTFCRAMGFQSDNHEENVITAVCQNRLDIAHALTEDEGVPIVVEITEGMELLSSYMNFHKPRTPISPNNDNNKSFPDVADVSDGAIRTNLDVVQQYHRLNRLRKNNGITITNPMDALNELFNDVSIYVSVTMCEIEKTTDTTTQTINQFWNEKLLFIIPYSTIDDIINDPTHTLARDTEHCTHYPQLSSFYGTKQYPNHITGDTQYLSHYFTSYGTSHDLPPIKLPYIQNSNSYIKTNDDNKNKTPSVDNDDDVTSANTNSRHVRFNIVKNTKIEEGENEETNEEDGNKHIKSTQTTVVHYKASATNPTMTSLQQVDSNTPPASEDTNPDDRDDDDNDGNNADDENDEYNNNDNNDKEEESMTVSTRKHRTGLTNNIGSLLKTKLNIKTGNKENSRSGTFDADPVPDQSPVITPADITPNTNLNGVDNDKFVSLDQAAFAGINLSPKGSVNDNSLPSPPPNVHLRGSSSLDPNLFKVGNPKLRGRESALRDSLHITKFRQSSIAPGAAMPTFQKKIYLDFNLFDDSGLNENNSSSNNNGVKWKFDDQPSWDFQPSVSTASIKSKQRKISRNRRKGSGLNKKSVRNLYKNYKDKEHMTLNDDHSAMNSDSGESIKSESEEEKAINNNNHGVSTPRSPTQLNETGGIDGGEGTFLGSAHISINIDDPELLSKYHTQVQEKEIKIGKKTLNKGKAKQSKLKFKIYCNALSAYLQYGKNYGDKLREHELNINVLSMPNNSKNDGSPKSVK